MKKMTVVQMEEGKWYRVKGYTHTECCDCALVHKEEIRLVDGHLEWRAFRDDKETDKRRKALKIKVTRAP
jgi:transcription initiation factor TFIIIB Brf1 subunit/transcription initiation factor TFIIB